MEQARQPSTGQRPTEPEHTLTMLRERAKELGYVLVHQDRIRTAYSTASLRKDYGFRMPPPDADRFIKKELAVGLAHHLEHAGFLDVTVSPQMWVVDYMARLTVIGPRAPHPDSMEYFYSAPIQR